MINKFFTRSAGLIDPALLDLPITIVGAGTIGSWTTLALAKMGANNISVFDGDIVSEENVGPQIYGEQEIGLNKAVALAKRLKDYVGLDLVVNDFIWKPEYKINDRILISAVDDMGVRKELWQNTDLEKTVFIDGRMAANELHVYTLKGNSSDYESTLFSNEQADPIPCSSRSVIYNALIVSGLIADVVAHIANEQRVPYFLEADLFNFDLFK